VIAGKVLALLALAGSLVAAGCSHPERLPAVPRGDTSRAHPLGLPNARFNPADPGPFMEEGNKAYERELALLRAQGKRTDRLPPVYYLAMSGGGDNGAFGSGLLNGWTAMGNRPEFKLVTGVSTGALIAPFAFLGTAYDPQLKEVYTTITPQMVYRERGLTAALFDDAMADTTPLSEVIARFADEKLLAAIAAEYNKGRLLLIGTTDLDAQRPVIWNIGAIAASGHPGALELVRKILRASAAIPGAFQPVMFDVEVDGKKYQEMHVDGGAIAQLFLYPPTIDLRHSGIKRERHAYVVRNARLDSDWANSERQTLNIAARAINTMLSASGHNDVLRTYFVTQRDGVHYHLAYIGADFQPPPKKGEFDPPYMKALYEYGYRKASQPDAWHKAPPALEHNK
jgi:hypothetical protein